MSEDILKILQIVNLVFPHVASLINVVRHPDGSVDINLHLDQVDAKLHAGLDAIEKYRAENP